MSIDPKALEKLNRDELIAKAHQLGATRPELLTRPELRDEIIRLSESDEGERRRARGWFGVARDLVASVVSQGLNLPDTAELIRGVNSAFSQKSAPPVATVTLAEIYAAQGHLRKAIDLLDEVLEKEPDHEAARLARARWAQELPSGARGASSIVAGDQSPPSEVASPGDAQSAATVGERLGAAVAQELERRFGAELADELSLSRSPAGTSEAAATATSFADEQPAMPAVETSSTVSAENDAAVDTPSIASATEDDAAVDAPSIASATENDAAVDAPSIASATENDAAVDAPGIASATEDGAAVDAPSIASATENDAAVDVPSIASATENAVPVADADAHAVVEANADADVAVPAAPVAAPEQDQPRVLLVRTAADALQCCWHLSDGQVQRLQAREPKGHLALRVIEVTAAWEGPRRRQFDLELPAATGQQRVTLDHAPTEVRVALGWLSEHRFIVIEIGSEFAWDHLNGAQLRWAAPAAPRELLEQLGPATVARMMQSVQAA